MSLAGQVVVVTGTVPGVTRDQLSAWLARLGATAGSDVTGATTILLVADAPGAAKVAAAEKKAGKGQAIDILDLAAFTARFGAPTA